MVIEEGITNVGYNAFTGCSALESMSIPKSVTEIGGYAFWGHSGIKDVTIPDGVTKGPLATAQSLQDLQYLPV